MSSVQSSTHTLEFSLRAEETVVNDTVKVVAEISALLTGGDENLQTSIREMMTKLIPTATWNFSNMVRSLHDTGYEQVTLTATARVSESENYNLENRAKQVSKTGLSITNINVDTSIPLKMLCQSPTTFFFNKKKVFR